MRDLDIVDGQGVDDIAIKKPELKKKKTPGFGRMEVIEETDEEYAEVGKIKSTEEFIKRKK